MSRCCPTLTFHPSMSVTTSFSDQFQLEMSCKSHYLVANITGKQKKYNQQAHKTLIYGLCLDLCKCPTLKNAHSEKTVQIWGLSNNF